jgi:hypothetical protein
MRWLMIAAACLGCSPLLLTAAPQDVPAPALAIYLFTDDAPRQGEPGAIYQFRIDRMRPIAAALERHQLRVVHSRGLADVPVKLTECRVVTATPETFHVFASAVVLGETVQFAGHGESWSEADDHLADDLAKHLRSREGDLLAARAERGKRQGPPASQEVTEPSGPIRIPMLIRTAAEGKGFTDPDQARKDSAADLRKACEHLPHIRLVSREEDAVLILEVLGRETTREVNMATFLTGQAQNKSHVSVRLTAGDFSVDFSVDGGSSGMNTGYRRAAGPGRPMGGHQSREAAS